MEKYCKVIKALMLIHISTKPYLMLNTTMIKAAMMAVLITELIPWMSMNPIKLVAAVNSE
ncbi:hypothetical protein [Marinicella meishanensis]|uniref:hypothetical protein n=1 Tax=Marinicella meishanensis TaxID=2873263 RepID=UPI001CBC6816|nr:hypothetical protein [Marinicella sp. NBU2979]